MQQKGNIDEIRAAMQEDFDKMPEKLRNEIYAAISEDAGRSKTDLEFGSTHLFADRARFVRVVAKMPSVQIEIKRLDDADRVGASLPHSLDEFDEKADLVVESTSLAQSREALMLDRNHQIEQLIARLDLIMKNGALMANKTKRLEALHALFNESGDRELKLEVYRKLGKLAKKSGPAAESYGREHFADDLSAVRKILQARFEKATLKAASQQMDGEF